MSTTTENLPITETLTPGTVDELEQIVRDAGENKTAIYPLGGGTSLEGGMTARRSGIGVSLERLNRVIDYPARDMTITVEAGITMAELARTLATEQQWLPIEVPQPEQATLGGAIASAWSGPRRYGWGTMRDYVIGISAVDGRGMPFKAGGRVVKNVAGYDFCKLLTGSMGTLAVITQATLKIKPIPEATALVVCKVPTMVLAEKLLDSLITSETTPSAIELLAGPAGCENDAHAAGASPLARLAIGFDGTKAEVDWMVHRLQAEWAPLGGNDVHVLQDAMAVAAWSKLTEFPAAGESPLVIKASMLPSRVTDFVSLVQNIDSQANIQAHAGNGVVIVRFSQFPAEQISRALIGRLQPAARACGGNVVVLSSTGLGDLTRQAAWGGLEPAHDWMTKVKRQFDPFDILNPGRSLYA